MSLTVTMGCGQKERKQLCRFPPVGFPSELGCVDYTLEEYISWHQINSVVPKRSEKMVCLPMMPCTLNMQQEGVSFRAALLTKMPMAMIKIGKSKKKLYSDSILHGEQSRRKQTASDTVGARNSSCIHRCMTEMKLHKGHLVIGMKIRSRGNNGHDCFYR